MKKVLIFQGKCGKIHTVRYGLYERVGQPALSVLLYEIKKYRQPWHTPQAGKGWKALAKKDSGSTVQKAWALAEPYARQLGLSLWDVLFVKEGASWYLRYIIDKEGGVNIDDCEALSRAVNDPLDEADFIKEAYYLEVSSPGLCRELKRPEHFAAMTGRLVRVLLIRPREKEREFIGALSGFDGQTVVMQGETGEVCFPKAEIAAVTLCDDLDEVDE